MRGSRFHQSFLFDQPAPTGNNTPTIGRSPLLIARRNRLLAIRYFYYSRLRAQRMIYPDVLDRLEKEFHLSASQITKIIMACSDELMRIKVNPPTLRELSAEFPHLVWSAN